MTHTDKIIKKLRVPFDSKVHAIPYAGNLFEEQAKKLVQKAEQKVMKRVEEMRNAPPPFLADENI